MKDCFVAMDYLKALEEERKKILVFERELPLSLQLVTQAIETWKKQMQEVAVGSEEITSGARPILEEFIPLRPSYSWSDEDNHHQHNHHGNKNTDGPADKKPDWLRSVQLWNQQPSDLSSHKKGGLMKPIAVNATRIGGAFHTFEREMVSVVKTRVPVPVPVVTAQASSMSENNGNGAEKEKEMETKDGNLRRKTRRCWSPELHGRFLNALQQLGGSHAATPKQIRELMKVDGVTIDEVKSHLQKFRLHSRRPSAPAIQSSSNGSTQQPQIVLVGGLWLPSPEYTAATAATLNGMYAPTTSLPSESGSQSKQKTSQSRTTLVNSERRCEGLENMEKTNLDSSGTSCSSQTTTASPQLQVC